MVNCFPQLLRIQNYPELKRSLFSKSEAEWHGFLAFDVLKFTQFNVSHELLNTL